MNKTKKEQQNALVVGKAQVNTLLIVLMVIFICVIGVSSYTNRESQVGTASYVEQLESLAESKGYTMEDKVTYKERQQLETEDGRYIEVMKYLEDTEVSEREFQEIKGIQSNYQQSVQQVNESGKNDYSLLIAINFVLLSIYALMLLIIFALRY